METAVSTLSTFNTSKDGIRRYVDQVVSEIKNGVMNPLLAKLYIKSMLKSLEQIEEQIQDDVMNEANKYEKNFSFHGAQIEQVEVGVKYEYNDIVLDELNEQILVLITKKKERETLLKSLKESMTIVDESTGEINTIYRPIKKSTSSIKITIK